MKKIIILAFLFILGYNQYTNAQSKIIVSLKGSVYNEMTKQPISVKFEVSDESGKIVNRVKSNSIDGSYFLTSLTPGKTYYIRNVIELGAATKYFRHKFEYTVPNTDQYLEFSKDFVLKPMADGEELVLPVSPFSTNRSKLRPGSETVLSSMIDLIRDNPRLKLAISCFPDKDDAESVNMQLTQERSTELKSYLISKGVSDDRLLTQSNAKLDPKNLPKQGKAAKGKKYKGSIYFIVKGL